MTPAPSGTATITAKYQLSQINDQTESHTVENSDQAVENELEAIVIKLFIISPPKRIYGKLYLSALTL